MTAKPPPRQRRALTHIGGRIELRGEPADARVLERALVVHSDEAETRAHVHGFHAYTARMHPVTARRLVEALSPPRATVLDPFCGSGTVLVEARLAGLRAIGIDANPLAVALANLKTSSFPERELERLVGEAERIAEEADARRKAKAGATRNYGEPDRALFDAHVLFELDGLRAGIGRLPRSKVRDALWLALSSILIKVSRSPGESGDAEAPRRLAGGFTLRMFRRRVEELARQLDAFARLVPRGVPPARALVGDARSLDAVPSSSVDLVVTSPPYPGVYDYVAHHATRLRWLGFDARGFEGTEIGSRRELHRLGGRAVRRWKDDFGRVLGALARVLAPGGSAVMLIADSAIGSSPILADEVGDELAGPAGLRLAAVASQARPHFHGPTQVAFRARPRCEHALLFRHA
ncbi:MAG: hypothetical protein FJ096_18295 [Deltaproteobacteria bacterium]|nr:hypothetical protein [Deltaproteobacteria bacterium]